MHKGVKLSAHVWVHDIAMYSWFRKGDRKPDNLKWDSLKTIFEGLVNMKHVAFLTVNWEKAGPHTRWARLLRIEQQLQEDVDAGMRFCQLGGYHPVEAWGILKWCLRAEEESSEAQEDRRVKLIQKDISELYTELYKTEEGKLVRAKLIKASEDQKKYMVPLLKQLESENLSPEEKTDLEKKIEEEYNLCLREFRGHFEEVRQMRIPIGLNLRHFYGLRDPLEPKKRFGIF